MVESEIDTDSISLTSTVESEHGPDDEFNVEEIMSEHGSANKKRYLIRWEGYALHKATWEPKENVLGLAALADWIELRQSMTKDNLQIYKKQREAEWDRARKREDRAKEIRRQKRRKKRMNLKQKSKRQPLPSDSEEDIPLNLRKPKISETITSKQQTLPPTSSDGSRQYSSLFEDSQEAKHPTPSRAADADDELFVKQGPVAKRPPLEQSSSDEDNDELGDPSLDKASRDANDASPQLPDQQSQKDVAPNLGNSLLAPKGSHRGAAVPTLQVTEKQHQLATNGQNGTQSEQPHAAPLESVETEGAVSKKTTPHLKTPMTQPPTKSTGLVNSPMTANPVGTREGSTPHLKTPMAQPPAKCTGQIINTPKWADPIRTWEGSSSYVSPTYAANTGPQPRPGAAVILPTSQPKTVASTSAVGTAASKSGVPTVLPSDKQNNMGSLNTSGIRIINEDKKKRKEWQNSDKPYNTLKARYNAVKRSHKEGTPDLHALEFVNGAPADLQKQKPRTPTGNPYGRREIVNPRFQEPVVDEPPKKTFEPLREWELNKIPEVCREWRLSKNCKYGPQRCKFMHRDQDQYGNDYKISDAFGRVQPKYRDPPLTCDFWFTSPHGCTKSQEKCEYAHWNTGFKPKDALYRDQIIKINPSLPPAFQENPLPPAFMEAPSVTESRPFHSKVPAEAVTCYFWATSTCHNEDNQCKYQHRHTGVVAPAPPSRKNSDIANQAFSIQPMQSSAMKPSRSQADNAEMAPNEPKSVVEKVAPGTAQVPNGDGEVPADQIINAEIGPNEPKKTHEKATPGTVQVPSIDGDVPLVRTAVIEQSPVHPQQTELPPATLSCLRLEKRIREALKIDIDVLFQTNGEQRSQMSCRKAMLLFHPTSHSVELEVLTRWLLMHHVEVSNAFSDGCWELFREHIGNSGCDIIIVSEPFPKICKKADLIGTSRLRAIFRTSRVWAGSSKTCSALVSWTTNDFRRRSCDPNCSARTATTMRRDLSCWWLDLHH